MPFIFLRETVAAYRDRDPAARSSLEVVLCYPGLHATLWHGLSHRLWRRGALLTARMVASLSRWLTGIEIHPAAQLGRRLVIDHGNGVVIGETAVVGDDVYIYHQVTLGGTSTARGKRHPTVEDGVIIGAGAKVLGAITIGARARIGANAVVVRDVPAGETVVGIPARPVERASPPPAFDAYGTPCEGMLDPLLRDLEGLRRQLHVLEGRMAQGTSEPAPSSSARSRSQE